MRFATYPLLEPRNIGPTLVRALTPQVQIPSKPWVVNRVP